MQNGRTPGVYTDWPSAQEQIRGFRNPRHKKFTTRAEAEAFVAAGKKASAYDSPQGLTPEEEIRRLIAKKSAPGLVLNGEYRQKDKQGTPYELGRGPLPSGAEDGYDPNIKLDVDGKIVARTLEERQKTKTIPKERDPPAMLRIYTDGSSLRNGQAGARAGVGVFFGPQDPKYDTPVSSKSSSPHHRTSSSSLPPTTSTVYTIDWQARGAPPPTKRPKLTWRYRNVSEALKGSKQTNQRAELTAVLRALDIAPRHREVTIYTDSKYSIDCVTNWYKNWEKNGWVNAKGKPVENRDLVQDIREKIEEREILGKGTYFVWVKGHANDAGNIAADRLANQGAMMARGLDNEEGDTETGSDGRQGSVDTEDLERGDGGESTEDEFAAEDYETRESLRLMEEAMAEDRL